MCTKNIQDLMLPIKQGIARTWVYAIVGFAKMQRKNPGSCPGRKKKFQAKRHLPVPQALHISIFLGGGWVRQECRVFCHQGVQLILAYSWARPAILAAFKGRGRMFLFLLFLHFLSFLSFSPVPLFHLLCYLFYLSSLGDDAK